MATFETQIDELDIGPLDKIEDTYSPHLRGIPKTRRLLIGAKDGTQIFADAPSELIDLLTMVCDAFAYGEEGDDDEQTLADLRAALLARNDRIAARRMAA